MVLFEAYYTVWCLLQAPELWFFFVRIGQIRNDLLCVEWDVKTLLT